MRKFLSILLIVLMISSLMPTLSFANDDVSVYLFGEKLEFDVPPQIINSRTLVPMRVIFEELGAQVNWNGETQTVTSTKGDKTIILTVGSYTMYVNSKEVTLDVAPVIVNQRTMVPARAVSESFDLKVDWDGDTRSVFITNPSKDNEIVHEEMTENEAYDKLKDYILKNGDYNNGDFESYLLTNGYIDVEYVLKTEGRSEFLLVRAVTNEIDGLWSEIALRFIKDLSPYSVISIHYDSKTYVITGHFHPGDFYFEKGTFIENESPFDYKNTQSIIDNYYLPFLSIIDSEFINLTGMSIKNFGVEY